MKAATQFLPLRSQVIYRHTRTMLDQSALCVRKFAMRVAEQYMQQVAPDQRQCKFRWGVTLDDLVKAEVHNAQILSRYMDGTVKVLPADLEDAWVCALPEPYRSECERDLARRRGTLAVKLAAPGEAGQAVSLGQLMMQVGELCEALAPALADGQITDADLPHARRILNESDDVIAAVLALRRQITDLLPEGERRNG
ncbi:hypothetical protein [Lysobacter olei]